MPIRRNAVPVASRTSRLRAASNSRSGRTVGLGSRAARVRIAKSAVFSFSTTPPAESTFSFSRRASFSLSHHRWRSRSSTCARSLSNVVSALIDFVSRPGSTRRSSSPRARRTSDGPSSPSRRRASRSVRACRWPSSVIPWPASRRARAGPIPGSSRTGSDASSEAASAAPITAKPRGLLRPAAIFASSRFGAKPIETVIPTSASTSRAKRASTTAGGAACNACVPARSTTASSIDNGCNSGVSRTIMVRICRPTATYLLKSGRITTASGHAFSALNIGIALCTPYMRAT